MTSELLWFMPFIVLFVVFNLLIIKNVKLKPQTSKAQTFKQWVIRTFRSPQDVDTVLDVDIEPMPTPEPPPTKPAKKPKKVKPEQCSNAQIDADHWIHQQTKRKPTSKS